MTASPFHQTRQSDPLQPHQILRPYAQAAFDAVRKAENVAEKIGAREVRYTRPFQVGFNLGKALIYALIDLSESVDYTTEELRKFRQAYERKEESR